MKKIELGFSALICILFLSVSSLACAKDSKTEPKAVVSAPVAVTLERLLEQVRSALQSGNATQALSLAQKARKLDLESYKPPYYIAYSLMALGEMSGAQEALDQSLALTKNDEQKSAVETLSKNFLSQRDFQMAEVAEKEGFEAKAANLYKSAFEASDAKPEAGLRAAKIYENRFKDMLKVGSLLVAVKSRFPDSSEASIANSELVRLKEPMKIVAIDLVKKAQYLDLSGAQAKLELAQSLSPQSESIIIEIVNMQARDLEDWVGLERRLKELLRARILEKSYLAGLLKLGSWWDDSRLIYFFRSVMGAEFTGFVASDFKDCDYCPEMIRIAGGDFSMGDLSGKVDSDEKPFHRVNIKPFAVGKFEVTFAEWDSCVAAGGCSRRPEDRGWGRSQRPVINVSWNDAQEYVQWLSRQTGRAYRLLSESEWEYVARAGTTTEFSTGDCLSTNQANFNGNYEFNGCGKSGVYLQKTQPVGSYAANPWGLHDVHGNVWEWTQDCKFTNYTNAPTDGSARMTGNCPTRVLRGGSWDSEPANARSANRGNDAPAFRGYSLGLRVARTL